MIGAMAFLALMVITGSSVSMMEPPMRSIGWTAFAVWAIGIQSLTWETQKVSWLLFALVIGAAEAPRSALRMPNPSPPGRRDGRHV